MVTIGKTTLSKEAGKHHTLEKFKELFAKVPDLKGHDLEKLYYQLGGKRKTVKKKQEDKE